MTGNVQSDTSGRSTYEQKIPVPQETTPASTEQKFQDKTVKGYEAEDIQKYGINRPIREIIHTKIVRQELPKTCIISEETKTTE
jgi:hypothetical protein